MIGIGEIFTSISSYELFYSQVPESMRSVCQALNLLTTSIGFIVTGGINSALSFWIPNNLNNGRLNYVYFLVSGLTLLAFFVYTYVSQSFVYKEVALDDDTGGWGDEEEERVTVDKSRHASGYSPAFARVTRAASERRRTFSASSLS